MDFSTEEAYQAELEKIIAKFEQLYNIGVRQMMLKVMNQTK